MIRFRAKGAIGTPLPIDRAFRGVAAIAFGLALKAAR
jgi:hypothetical protein